MLQWQLESYQSDLVNIVGNVVGNVDVIEIENKNGEGFKVANFSVVSKDDEGRLAVSDKIEEI